MTPTLPFTEAELSRILHSRRPFAQPLKRALQELRLVLDRAHREGPTPDLQESYARLRFWFGAHLVEVRQVLCRREPAGESISTLTLESTSADRLGQLLQSRGLPVDRESDPRRWRPLLNALIAEADARVIR